MSIKILSNIQASGDLKSGSLSSSQFKVGAVTAANIYTTEKIGVNVLNPTQALEVVGNVSVTGNLSALGDITYLDTDVTRVSSLEITNDGSGPTLRVVQTGNAPVASFEAGEGNYGLFIDGHSSRAGNVGIGTNVTRNS